MVRPRLLVRSGRHGMGNFPGIQVRMTALKFLDRLAQLNLLAPRDVEKLRQQVQASAQPVTAEALAGLLVKKERLTREQARRVLRDIEELQPIDDGGPVQSVPPVVPSAPAKPAESPRTAPRADAEEELGLAPDRSVPSPQEDEVLSVEEAVRPPQRPAAPRAPASPTAPTAGRRPPAAPPSQPPAPPTKPARWSTTGPGSEANELSGLDDGLSAPGELSADGFDDSFAEVASGRTVGGPRGWRAILAQLRGGGGQRRYRGNRWDSPLILAGGGALLVLSVVAIGLYFFLTRGTGDDAFNLANEDYRQQSYTQAIAKFQQFVRDYPGHPKESLARVRIATAEIWNHVERKNWSEALEAVRQQLPPVETQEAFQEARPELASLLPEIMDGFAEQAADAGDAATAQTLLQQAEETLKEVDNASYLPSSVRRSQQPRIEQIQGKLASVRRRINQDRELEVAVGEIRSRTQENQILEAYAAREALLRKYPGLELDRRLEEAVRAVTEREKSAVRSLETMPEPATDAAAGAAADFEVPLAHRHGDTVKSLAGQAVCVITGGVAYALQAEDGSLLWRRDLGAIHRSVPLEIEAADGGDLLLVDERNRQLLRVRARSGELVWRLPCPGVPFTPVLAGGQVFVTCSTGDGSVVLALDPATGKVSGGASLPVPTATGPAVDVERGLLFQPADHSSLYQLQLKDWACVGVHYLGHAPGTLQVPPLVQAGMLVCAENAGPDFALLHLLGEENDKPGVLRSLLEPPRLEGQVVVPMLGFGRRILLTTNRGRLQVWEVDRSQAETPLRLAAENVAAVAPNTASYALLDEGRLWVGDNQLSYYELQTSRGQLTRKWLNLKGDRFVAPLRRRGSVLLHARQRAGRTGITVAATQLGDETGGRRDGELIWETELAMPLAGLPFIPAASEEIRVISQDGLLFTVGKEAMKQRKLSTAESQLVNPPSGPLERALPLDDGRLVISGPGTTKTLVLYDGKAPQPLRSVPLDLAGAEVAAAPARLGAGIALPTDRGAVHWVDASSGKSLGAPFTPSLAAGARVEWWPAASTPDAQSVVLADRRGNLYRVTAAESPARLELAREASLDTPPLAAPAVTAETLFVVVRRESKDVLRRYRMQDLQPLDSVELPGAVNWGPHAVGTQVLLQIDNGKLLVFDSEGDATTVEMQDTPLVGTPAAAAFGGEGAAVAGLRGQVLGIDLKTGTIASSHDLRVSLGTGPVLLTGRFLVGGVDGTLYIAKFNTEP